MSSTVVNAFLNWASFASAREECVLRVAVCSITRWRYSTPMPVQWDWPGARWWRCDLHVHSPGSHDFVDRDATPRDWLQSARNAGLDVVAVTDHNGGEFIDALRRDEDGSVVVLAGVELTSSEGVHLLALWSSESSANAVRGFLGDCGIPGEEFGNRGTRAAKPYKECIEIAARHGALCIAPHADADAGRSGQYRGLLKGIGDNRHLSEILQSPNLVAAEVVTNDAGLHDRLRGRGQAYDASDRALVRFSDAHDLSAIGQRSTWIKMTRPDPEGLRLALTDGERSIRVHRDGVDPNRPPTLAVEAITIEHARVVGRSDPLTVAFNPWYNAIIGGRGAGKSTLVEMLRFALDRGGGLSGTIGERFKNFARVYKSREDFGALTEDTKVTVIYRKGDARYRVTRTAEASEPMLEVEGRAGWEAAEGSVRSRLPIQIFSQNEIHEIAREPAALLRIVDATEEVDRRSWAESFEEERNRFLALRAEMRQLSSVLQRERDLRGEFDEVGRQLAAFESEPHKDVLREYRARAEQERAVEVWEQDLEQDLDSIRESLQTVSGGLRPRSLSLEDGFDPDDSVDRTILEVSDEAAASVADARQVISDAADQIANALATFRTRRKSTKWAQAVQSAKEAYDRLVTKLQAEGVSDPDSFSELVARRDSLQAELQGMEAVRSRLCEVSQGAESSLERLQEMRRSITERRATFLSEVLAAQDLVRVEMDPYGDRERAYKDLEDILGMQGTFEQDLRQLVDRIYSAADGIEERLAEVKRAVKQCAEGDESAISAYDRRFINRLRMLTAEQVDRLEAWFPEDLLRAKYAAGNNEFRPISQGSAGEQNAAILAFLLSYGDAPIVIDQPENDLDNRLISGLVVRSLVACKRDRQLVVVTHNPNIVVNADAELVVSLEMRNGEVQVAESGGLQEQKIRDEICNVVEGGREAFELRYNRIGRSVTV